jgi:predicted  nucleic acid-binding Zn-ribbon protein
LNEELLAIRDLWKVDHALDQNRQRRAQFQRAAEKNEQRLAELRAQDAALAAEDATARTEERRLHRHLEDYVQRRAATEAEIAATLRAIDELAARLARETPGLDQDLAALQARRPALLAAVPIHHHGRYEDLRRRHRDVLSLVEGGCCSACRIQVPAQVAIEVTTGKRVHNCRGCDRYLLDHAPEPE